MLPVHLPVSIGQQGREEGKQEGCYGGRYDDHRAFGAVFHDRRFGRRQQLEGRNIGVVGRFDLVVALQIVTQLSARLIVQVG